MNFAQSSAVYFNYSLEYAIQDLANLGYQGIEIWGGRPHMYRNDLDDQIGNIVTLLQQNNLSVCNFIPAQFRYPSILCSENETVRNDSIAYIKTAMANAIKVNSPSISICPGMTLFDQRLDRGWKMLLKSLQQIDEYNQDLRLNLLIEPAHRYESNLILTVEDCLRIIDELKSDNIGILLDTGHARLNNENFKEIIPKCKGLPLHIHIDDNNGDIDAHLIPGQGTVDFKSLVTALREIDFNGFVSAELGTSYIMNPTEACRKSLEVLNIMFS